MAFPGVRQNKTLYATAKRVVDELGKAQEILRHVEARALNVASGAEARRVVFIPQVDIIVVGIEVAAEDMASLDTANVLAPAAYDTAAGATNKLCTEIAAASVPNDTIFQAVLSGLNGNKVAAGQPIILVVTEVGSDSTIVEFFVQVNYILADNERSY
jgi:hypothetical protein